MSIIDQLSIINNLAGEIQRLKAALVASEHSAYLTRHDFRMYYS